jgi:hypothetical protein
MSVTSLATLASAQPAATGPDNAAAVSESTSGNATQNAAASAVQPTAAVAQPNQDRYRDGMVIWETPADARVPFLLRFNINTQLRYLNTQDSDETFTDHMGIERDVHTRNDITVNRAMFIFGGYVFDQRLRYSFTVWTSAGARRLLLPATLDGSSTRRWRLPPVTQAYRAAVPW